MTAKHTPGPWKAEGTVELTFDEIIYEFAQIFSKDSTEICVIDTETQTSEWRANARLIAAAPDLLAAAVEALGALRSMIAQFYPDYACPYKKNTAELVRAIKKATEEA